MKCKKCGGVLFAIQVIPCCDDCDQNGASGEDEDSGYYYEYDLKIIEEKELERTQVGEERECKMGTAYGSGCYMFVCDNCHERTNLPVMDGC